MQKDPSNVSGAFRGILCPPCSLFFLSSRKATARIFVNAAMDLSSSSSEDRRLRLGKGEGCLIGVVHSEEGSESSSNTAGAVGPFESLLAPFLPLSCASWDWRRASRSRRVSLRRAAHSIFSLKQSSAVGDGGHLIERFQMPFLISAVELIDSALASWKFCSTVVFSSSRFCVDKIALAIVSSTLARTTVCS